MPKRPKNKLLLFLKSYGGYNAGERATFTPARAAALIEAGVAAEPSVLEKAAAAAQAAKRKVSTKPPEVGSPVSFSVDGLGELTGTVVEMPVDGPIKVQVGKEGDTDLYDCEASELTVLE